MKRKSVSALFVVMILVISISLVVVSAPKPPKTTLTVSISNPLDGFVVDHDGSFVVKGQVTALKGDAGFVDTYVQYAIGEGSTDFIDIGGTNPNVLHVVSGNQPQTQPLSKDQSYSVSWMVSGPAGTYEIRIRSEGELSKSGESDSVTVQILAAPPPPGVVRISSEQQDPATGFGVSIGSYASTFSSDGTYEILSEAKNPHGTKKPVDDTTELGWIFNFELPTPRTSTSFYFFGYADLQDGDSDTAFFVQAESGGSWNTIMEISHTGHNRLLSVNIADLSSPTVSLRIIDDDRTIGNKAISSLYIDQAFIGVDDYQPPVSGIEILTAPYTCHRFQAWEYYDGNWYHDADIPLSSTAATDFEIVDLDFDGRNELVVAEVVSETYVSGVIEIFDLDYGTTPIETLLPPAPIDSAVMSIEVGNFDEDQDLEIAAGFSNDGAVIWDKVDGEYQVSLLLLDTAILDYVVAGNMDADPELEVVFTVGFDPDLCEVALFDYDSGLGSWVNTANYTFSTPEDEYRFFYNMEINDVDGDGFGELYVIYVNSPFRILTYTNGELVDFWATPDVFVLTDVGCSFVTGDITNDGNLDLVFYSPFLTTGTGFRIFEFDEVLGFVNTYNISNPGMNNLFGNQMAIGDVDGDLMNELVVSGGPGGVYGEGNLYIFRYDTLIFATELNANESNCVVIGDYDNDA